MPSHEFETVIGLEVHAQLKTRTKAFCACPVVFGASANTAVCPVCLGYPGALPVLNREMVSLALRLALATGCEVHETSVFARKNYFYPDLPKGYQISQYDRPLATGGAVEVRGEGGAPRAIRLNRIHLEEDAGKSMHEAPWDDVPAGVLPRRPEPRRHPARRDRHRARPPLARGGLRLPRAAPPARPLGRRLRRQHGGRVPALRRERLAAPGRNGDARDEGRDQEPQLHRPREEGARARDRPPGGDAPPAGARSSRRRASSTPGSGTTRPMRSKEEAMDYRYFPDPDLGALVVDARLARRRSPPRSPSCRSRARRASPPRSASPRPTPRRSARRAPSPTPSRRPSPSTPRTRRGSRTGSSATSSRG